MTIKIIKFYQEYISPMLGMNCRFIPSCSEYALQAVQKYGTRRGIILSVKRLVRCQPFAKSGYDPVP